MKYRSRTEIVAEILKWVADGPQGKTHIMYHAYLSYTQVKEYLTALIRAGLLMPEGGKFAITDKGREYLVLHKKLNNLADFTERKRLA